MNEVIKVNGKDILTKEYKGQRVVTLSDVDTVHERIEGTAKRNFSQNKSHLIEGEDYFMIPYSEFRTNFVPNHAQGGNPNVNIALLTESGYLMLVKSFTDDLAWDVQRKLVNSYFRIKESIEDLSPQTQLLIGMVNQIAEMERKANEATELARKAIETTESIKEAVKPVSDDTWREEINKKFNRIQRNTDYQFNYLRTEMYSELERRAGCDLSARVRNKIQRMEETGCRKTDINKVNRMDIISEDKRLREIFAKIVTEYEIRYCA